MTRWGLDAEDGLVPLSLLNWVNRMFMVARSTSERLCLIYREKTPGIRERDQVPRGSSKWKEHGLGYIPQLPMENYSHKRELVALWC